MENYSRVIYTRSYKQSGCRIILDSIINEGMKRSLNFKVYEELEQIEDEIFLVYGVNEIFECIVKKKSFCVAYLADAESSIHLDWFKYSLLSSYSVKPKLFFKYIYYRIVEYFIVRRCPLVVVVNHFDQKYLGGKSNILTIQNGVSADEDFSNDQGDNLNNKIIGVLSSWGRTSFKDLISFLDSKDTTGYKIHIYGRGLDENFLSILLQYRNVVVKGEVYSLAEFYSRVDIVLCYSIKRAGILNKALEALAHNKVVIGLKRNLYWCDNLQGVHCIDDVINLRDMPISSPDYNERLSFLSLKHNWSKNLKYLFDAC